MKVDFCPSHQYNQFQILMQQYLELGQFKSVEKELYEETKCNQEDISLYIHKKGYPNVTVKALEAKNKVYCWRIRKLQITQYAGQWGTRQKAVAVIQFDGQIIFTLIHTFNEVMGKEILQYVENISSELRLWCAAPIKNIFRVTEKAQQSLGFRQGFIEITPILHYLQRYYYFEYRRWKGDDQQQLLEIQKAQHLEDGRSSFASIFQAICDSIQQQKQARRKKEELREEIKRRKQERVKKIEERKRREEEKERLKKQRYEEEKRLLEDREYQMKEMIKEYQRKLMGLDD